MNGIYLHFAVGRYWGFNLSHANGRKRVCRRRRERFANACDIERDRFRGGSVLVWRLDNWR